MSPSNLNRQTPALQKAYRRLDQRISLIDKMTSVEPVSATLTQNIVELKMYQAELKDRIVQGDTSAETMVLDIAQLDDGAKLLARTVRSEATGERLRATVACLEHKAAVLRARLAMLTRGCDGSSRGVRTLWN